MIFDRTMINCLFFFTWWHIICVATCVSFIDNVHVCVIIIVITLGGGWPMISTKPLLGGVPVVFCSVYTVPKNIVVRRLYITTVFHTHTKEPTVWKNNLNSCQYLIFLIFTHFLFFISFVPLRGEVCSRIL